MTGKTLFELQHLRCSYDKHYREGISRVVLEIEHLALPMGKIIFIVGESGIGKSTILETLGMMNNTIVHDDSSSFLFFDEEKSINLIDLWQKGDRALSEFRLKNYSFIFQNTNLMKNFTAIENIAFTRMLQGYSKFSCFQRAKKVLADLGLEHVDDRRMAHELSGGQQQRLSFARAILPDFAVLFGDEPTGNLDSENAIRVMTILNGKMKETPRATAIIVSHDMHLAVSFADVIIKIRKCLRPKVNPDDESITYGLIDDKCVFVQQDSIWTNGDNQFSNDEFEVFLRQKTDV